MPQRPPPAARAGGDRLTWTLFLVLSVIWGSSYLFIRIGLEEGLPPLTLVSLRTVCGALFLGLVMLAVGGRVPRSREAWRRLGIVGMTQIAVPFVLITWGQQHIASGLAGILNALTPLFAVLLASLVLHDEPVTVARLGGVLVGFAGVVILSLPSVFDLGGGESGVLALLAMGAVAAASVSYAVATVYTRHRITGRALVRGADGIPRAPSAVEISFAQLLVGGAVTSALALLLEGPAGGLYTLPGSALAWLVIAWLGVLGSGLAYILFMRIIAAWGATRATLVTYAIPVVAVALGFLVLGERFRPLELLGAALIIGGVVLANAPLAGRVILGRAPR